MAGPILPIRVRKLIGTVLLVVLVVIYSLAVMTTAMAWLENASVLYKTIFYAIGGFAWVFPAMIIIWWMQRPDRKA